MAGAGAVAGVLVDALRARITAIRPRGDVVGLAGTRAVAGVRVVALAGGRIAAGRPGDLEAVSRAVLAHTVATFGLIALARRRTADGRGLRISRTGRVGPVAVLRRIADPRRGTAQRPRVARYVQAAGRGVTAIHRAGVAVVAVDRSAACAGALDALLAHRAGVAVVAGGPVGLGRIRAEPRRGIAHPRIVALIRCRADDRVGADTRSALASVSLGAQVPVVTGVGVGNVLTPVGGSRRVQLLGFAPGVLALLIRRRAGEHRIRMGDGLPDRLVLGAVRTNDGLPIEQQISAAVQQGRHELGLGLLAGVVLGFEHRAEI